jgi:hypothetical protein
VIIRGYLLSSSVGPQAQIFNCWPLGNWNVPFLVGLVRGLYIEVGRNKSAFPDRVQLLPHAKVEILIPHVESNIQVNIHWFLSLEQDSIKLSAQ